MGPTKFVERSTVICQSARRNIAAALRSNKKRDLISKMDLREICCEDGRWMELAEDRVQWQALVLAVLNLLVLLP
jgi:hypothetical protein